MTQESQKHENSKFFFCYYTHDVLGLYFIELLAKRNQVSFVNMDEYQPNRVSYSSIFVLLSSHFFRRILHHFLVYLLVYRKAFEIFELYETEYVLGISPEKLIENYPMEKSLIQPNTKIFKANIDTIFANLQIESYDILFLDDGEANELYELGELNNILSELKTSGFEITIKPHPSYPLQIAIPGIRILPSEIPAEILMGKAKRAVLANYSQALINFDSVSVKKISLIEIIHWKIDDSKSLFKNHLKLGKDILYPLNVDDLKKLME
ncbi:hypothetical protein JYU23_01740 [bacterium AH-315-C07]|nr:hypothetical protein [bacterium AH-315-C07]